MTLNYPDAHTAERKPVSLRPEPWNAPRQPQPSPARPAVDTRPTVQTPFRPNPRHSDPVRFDPVPESETAYALAWSALCRRKGHTGKLPDDRPKNALTTRGVDVLRALHGLGSGTGAEVAQAMGATYKRIGGHFTALVDHGLVNRVKVRRAADKPGVMVWRYTVTAKGLAEIGGA